MNHKKSFFILGYARSGTTSMARILQLATNAEVHIEQPPNLCYESRDVYKGILNENCIYHLKKNCITRVNERGLIYGDKNQNYLPFLNQLYNFFNSKFIIMVRDPRDVIRSSMSWSLSKNKKGGLYSLKEDGPNRITDKSEDWWDYSRLRPNQGHQMYTQWPQTELFEKICWAWAEYYSILLDKIEQLDTNTYMMVNISTLKMCEVFHIYDFLGLKTPGRDKIKQLLHYKTNSIEEKTGSTHLFPHWKTWNTKERQICTKYCNSISAEIFSRCVNKTSDSQENS